jgi:hypothetical protein
VIQFAYPWALLALLALPLIIILHSLRPKRRTLLLSTTALWRQALRERRRGLGLQKLLRDLSLILLLLFALIVALGLAEPQWLTRGAERHDSIIVLDVSASMQVRVDGAGTTRFDSARSRAAALIDDLPDGARMAIMTSGRAPLLRSAFESSKDTLHSVLAGLQPGDEAGRPRAALALALSLLRKRERSRIYFLSDAAFDDNIDFASPLIEYIDVGGGPGNNDNSNTDNIAITRFDFRPEIGSEERFQVLLSVRNYSARDYDIPVAITLNRDRLLAQNLQLPAAGEKTLVLPFRGRLQGRAQAQLDIDDALAADNQAFAVMSANVGLRVLLIGAGDFYLLSLLEALPNLTLEQRRQLPAADELALLARRHDVLIFDRIDAPPLPAGRYLLIDSIAPGLPFTASGSIAQPLIAGKGAASLVRQLDLSGVKIARARRITFAETRPSGLQRLFWSHETDLALALLQNDIRLVYLGFDLAQSNFPLQTAFPLFISQTLDWLRSQSAPIVSSLQSAPMTTQLAAGEAFAIEVPDRSSSVIITTPAGEGLIYRPDSIDDSEDDQDDGVPLLFDATSRVGIYRYQVDQIERYFAVNLTDEYESDITPRAIFPQTGAAPMRSDTDTGAQITLALWPYLTGIALLLLTLEWGVWCARRGSA